jgi:hypothetical protein
METFKPTMLGVAPILGFSYLYHSVIPSSHEPKLFPFNLAPKIQKEQGKLAGQPSLTRCKSDPIL